MPAGRKRFPASRPTSGTACSCRPATAPEIIAKLNAGLNAVLRQPDIAVRLKQLNVESRANTPEEFRAFVAAEIDKWGKVVREANIKLG